MKKILLFVLLSMISVAAFAQMSEEQSARLDKAMQSASKGHLLLIAARSGKVSEFRKNLINAPHDSLRVRDAYGNNLLHAASSREIFAFIWGILDKDPQLREVLLTQKNKAGEIPFMTHIMYGHEDIFLEYFPRTDLSRQLQRVSADLAYQGILQEVASDKKDYLLKQCTTGNKNMWQRAQDFYQDTKTDAYAAPYREKMKRVRDMIARVAPFMVAG